MHPKVVADMLGHSQVGITRDLYSHVTPTMQWQATEALDAGFGALVSQGCCHGCCQTARNLSPAVKLVDSQI